MIWSTTPTAAVVIVTVNTVGWMPSLVTHGVAVPGGERFMMRAAFGIVVASNRSPSIRHNPNSVVLKGDLTDTRTDRLVERVRERKSSFVESIENSSTNQNTHRTVFSGIVLQLTGEAFRYLLVQATNANITQLRGNSQSRTLFWPLVSVLLNHW